MWLWPTLPFSWLMLIFAQITGDRPLLNNGQEGLTDTCSETPHVRSYVIICTSYFVLV